MITDYEHLPVGTYEAVLEASKVEDNDLAIVSALSGKTEDELLNMPLTEYRTLADGASFLFYLPQGAKVRKTYEVGDFRLCFDQRADKITTAQYIDFKEYAKAGETDIVKYLAIVLIPEGKRYNDGYDLDAVISAIREHLPITDAIGVRDFFVSRLRKLTAASLTYSQRLMRRTQDTEKAKEIQEKIAELQRFFKSGAGSTMWNMLRLSHAGLGMEYIR